MFKLLFIYIRAIWHIVEVVDSLEVAGYILAKDNYSSQTRERDLAEKTLLKIGAWKKINK